MLNLADQASKHRASRLTPDQAGTNDDGAKPLRDFLRLEFRLSVERAAPLERADAGNIHQVCDLGFARGTEQFFRTGHVGGVDA